LSEYTKGNGDEQTVAVAGCFEHLHVACTGGCILLLLDGCSDLDHLVVDKLRVLVVSAVPLCQDLTCFLGAVHGNEPSWALRSHEQTGKGEERNKNLKQRGDSPRPRVFHVAGTESEESSDKSSDVLVPVSVFYDLRKDALTHPQLYKAPQIPR